MVGFYAGSFDPFTNGHLYITKLASGMFDHLIIGIGINENKSRRFDAEKMKEGIIKTLKEEGINNAEVVVYSGLTALIAKSMGADFLVRGIRNEQDYMYEENLAQINREIAQIETIYFRAGEFGIVSSSMVYELLKRGIDVKKYLPPTIFKLVCEDKEK